MGYAILHQAGGGGVTSDDVTASKNDVLQTASTVTTDSNDEVVAGTIPVRSKINGSIKPNETYTIPAGYYAEAGTVTCPVTISPVVSFSVASSAYDRVTATWQWPAKGPYSGVLIRYKEGGYPSSVTDGTEGYKGTGTGYAVSTKSSATITGLKQDTRYYFRIWVYLTCSDTTRYSGTYMQADCYTAARGMVIFKTSQTWTVPARVTKIDIFCVGGGGSGGPHMLIGSSRTWCTGAGGGSGYTATKKGQTVTPGTQYAVTVGAGGVAASRTSDEGTTYYVSAPGGASSFGSILSAAGGKGGGSTSSGEGGYFEDGGDGGSGGGAGAFNVYPHWSYLNAGNGGSDGSDGTEAYYKNQNDEPVYSVNRKGTGQGSTTRAFEESSGTLYSGGGGGASYSSDTSSGTGGAGGGGAGGVGDGSIGRPRSSNGTAGTANTGGGGGGGGTGSNGGSGVVIVRWGY